MDPTNSTPNNAEPNHGTFNYVAGTTVVVDGSAQTNGYDCEMMLTTRQLTNPIANASCVIPEYMIRRIRVFFDGDLIEELPPEDIFEPMPH